MYVTCLFLFLALFFIFAIVLLFGWKPRAIRKLTRQAARWLIAAEQDESPMIATLHAQYGMGYVWALKDIVSPTEFLLATGSPWHRFEQSAVGVQDKVSRKMIDACPDFAGDVDQYLARMAGEA